MRSSKRSKVCRGFRHHVTGPTGRKPTKPDLKRSLSRASVSRDNRSVTWGRTLPSAEEMVDRMDEAQLGRAIDRLFAKLDKKKGKARLAKPSRRTLWSSWKGIKIMVPRTDRSGKELRERPRYAMSLDQIAAILSR